MLLAATSLIASFLGSQALARGGLTTVAWIAIGALACSLIAAVVVLLPSLSLSFAVQATRIQPSLAPDASLERAQREVQRQAAKTRAANAPAIRRLFVASIVAALAVVLRSSCGSGSSPLPCKYAMSLHLIRRRKKLSRDDPAFDRRGWLNELGERMDDPRSWWKKMWEPWYPEDEADLWAGDAGSDGEVSSSTRVS
jgi:hypothetical protein